MNEYTLMFPEKAEDILCRYFVGIHRNIESICWNLLSKIVQVGRKVKKREFSAEKNGSFIIRFHVIVRTEFSGETKDRSLGKSNKQKI